MSVPNLPGKTDLSSIKFLLRRSARHGHLMQVAQRLGREFTEEEAVVLGQAAEVPDTELRGNVADCRARWICRFECSPNLVKSSHVQILHWSDTEVVLKRITKRTLRHTCRNSELFHG